MIADLATAPWQVWAFLGFCGQVLLWSLFDTLADRRADRIIAALKEVNKSK